ncbi:MAG: hypothetical protein JWQ48_1272 [Conexibacter sp.]|nr:hypothetical protein [Conexibacter sp.]
MLDPLLPRLKKEIEARLAELRPLVAEVEQLENAKAALLDGGPAEIASAAATARAARAAAPRAGRSSAPRRAARAATAAAPAAATPPAAAEESNGAGRAPRGANREAILTLVEERPGVSVSEIASVTKIPKATVATTVSKLKRDGVLADEAGGVKLASRAPVTIASALPQGEEAPAGDADAEWDAADPKADAAA